MSNKKDFDPERASKVLEHVRDGETPEQCAAACGIDEETLAAWVKYGQRNSMSPQGEWLRAIRKAQAQWHVRAIANVTAGKPGAGTLLRIVEKSKRPALDGAPEPKRLSSESVDDIVRAIATQMAKGEWFGTVSTQELAAELGVPIKAVQNWATDASRLVRLADDAEQLEAMRASHLARLERISRDAHADGKFRDATGAIRVANEICGTIRSDTTVSVLVQNQVTNVAEALMSVMCPECLARAADVMGEGEDE